MRLQHTIEALLVVLVSLSGCAKEELPDPPSENDTATSTSLDTEDSGEPLTTETEPTDTEMTEPDHERPPECEGLPTVTWEGWSDGFFKTWCRACHSAATTDRNGAPEGMDFDTEAQVVENASLVRYSVLDEERMPLGGGLYKEDLYLLEVYLDCEIP